MSTRGKWSPNLVELNAWEIEQRRVIASEGRRIASVSDTPVTLIPIKRCYYTWNLDWWALGAGYTDGDLAKLEIDNTRKLTPGHQRVIVFN